MLLPPTSDLDVLNSMLEATGEAPLESEDDEHPLLPAAKRIYRQVMRAMQSRSWFYNEEVVTLIPDPATGFVYVPNDALRVVTVNPYDLFVKRGSRMFDSQKSSYVFSKPMKVELTRLLPISDIPEPAAELARSRSVVRFCRAYEGDPVKQREAEQAAMMASIEISAEETRQRKANLLLRNSTLNTLGKIAGTRRTVL